MYTRFVRWATDRLDENGIIAFVSNSSFIDSRAFDGFRKCLADDFTTRSGLSILKEMRGQAANAGDKKEEMSS